ncbi:MAG: SMP-30/gluconolactonase/LRE family protein, partial [Candidatus Brocadiia bacterium]|nr:SMP-30/gluconolactonase/LRE family protein [Candidatus Brocadiia bacterium]
MTAGFSIFADGIPFPEGPVFDSQGNLFVCARRDGYIVKVTPDGSVHKFIETGGKPNGLAIDAEDVLYVADATRREILMVDRDAHLEVLIPTACGPHELKGPNDLCFGPSGAMYFTDPGLSLSPEGVAYRYNLSTSELTLLATGMSFPNGLAISSDEKTLLVAETMTFRLLKIDLSGPATSNPEVVAEFGDGANPDGMAWLDGDRLAVALHRAAA